MDMNDSFYPPETGALLELSGGLLVSWYAAMRRPLPWREGRDPYKIWVSEIMLQQTRIEAVKPYFARFMAELPDMEALARVDEERLMKLWEGLGYYSRARNLKKCAGIVVEQYGGRFPADHEVLKKLPGIGPYTAGAIASIAYGLAVPAVDGNVLRVLSRLCASRADVALPSVKREAEGLIRSHMPQDSPGEFNEALMELGETVCVPSGIPLCDACPLRDICLAKKEGVQRELPVKARKKARRVEERTVVVLLCERGSEELVAIERRPEKGLLAGLYGLPSWEGRLTEAELRERLELCSFRVESIAAVENARHLFSHVEWDMTGYVVRVAELPKTMERPEAWMERPEAAGRRDSVEVPDIAEQADESRLLFVEKKELRERYALPSAFKAFMPYFL